MCLWRLWQSCQLLLAGAVLETLSVNEEMLDHHYTRHERSRSSRKEDERLPWRKAKR